VLAAATASLGDHTLFDAAVDEADRHPFAGRAWIAQDALGREQLKQGVEEIVGHHAFERSSNSCTLATRRRQCSRAGEPWRRASTRIASARRTLASAVAGLASLAVRRLARS